MAWNKYYVVVTNQQKSPEEIRSILGLTDYVADGPANFLQTNKSEDLFIGNYKDKVIIADPDITGAFFLDPPSDMETRFVVAFPDAEIAALIEDSTVGAFGFAIINNGQRIRLKDGCDGEIYHDMGTILPEEQEILNGHIFDPEELKGMREEMEEEEVQNSINFEASWRVPSRISQRYFGEIIDNLADDAIKMTRYRKL